MMSAVFDVIVLGGGAGGLSVTSACAQLGLKVLLVEKNKHLGGDCLHTGCVPSKSLIYCANLVHQSSKAHQMGLMTGDLSVDYKKSLQHVHEVIANIQNHDSPERFRRYGAKVIFGVPRFTDEHHIEIEGQLYQGRYFVIATGSHPFVPSVPGLKDLAYWTTDNLFQDDTLPKRLAVVGGGVIAVEMAQAFARLGSKVTIFERNKRLLHHIDKDATKVLSARFDQEGITMHHRSHWKQCYCHESACVLEWTDEFQKLQNTEFDKLLIATGRAANVEGLALDKAGVQFDTRQGIVVNDYLGTNQKHIFALGDVVNGPYKLTHMAEHHAGIVVAQIAFKWRKKVNHNVVPTVIYTDPEIAIVGHGSLDTDVLFYDHRDLDRAIIENSTDGFVKIHIKGQRIVGAVVVGPHAGEIIHPLALLIQQRKSMRALSTLISPYPSWSQVTKRTVNQWFADKLFSPRARQLVQWIKKLPF